MEDPFHVLGLPAGFDTDPAQVQRAYLAAVASVHPDLADPDLAAEAARRSAALNRARAQLLDPEARARALLTVLAGGAADDERGLPEGFLAGMLETRMTLEEASAAGDRAELDRLRTWAAEERSRHIERVGELFHGLAEAEAGERASRAREIRRELNAWRYIERMLEQVGASE